MFEARPLPGADKSIVATLEHLLRSKLPRGVPVSFHLVSSKLVGNDIDYGLREFRWSGKQAKKFNAITRPTISGQRRRSSPASCIWIYP
jgi:conjugal transfer ATP-binding protein TraC